MQNASATRKPLLQRLRDAEDHVGLFVRENHEKLAETLRGSVARPARLELFLDVAAGKKFAEFGDPDDRQH